MNLHPLGTSPAPIQPLRAQLPALATDEARLRRLALDDRFERWLRALLGLPRLAVDARPATGDGLALAIETGHGRFEVGIDSATWPALQVAAALPDDGLACEVATALLQPHWQPFADALGAARVVARRSRAASEPATVAVRAPNGELALAACDEGLALRVGDVLAALAPTGAPAWHALLVRPRLHVLARTLPAGVLRTLAPGDLLLAGPAPLRGRVIAGLGQALEIPVDIHLQEHTVHVTEEPRVADADVDAATPSPAGRPGPLDRLELPVSFELDTARISLAELAALRPGAAIELDVALDQAAVRLVCHGQTIGSGRLVAIGEQLGVLINQMDPPHDVAAER